MVTREDLESYLVRMEVQWEELADGMLLVQFEGEGAPIVVHYSPPYLLLRMKVLDLPESAEGNARLYRTLLELNVSDLVHGAFGIEEQELILTDTLELESLDFSELQASLDSIQIAAATNIDRIRELAGLEAPAPAASAATTAAAEGEA